MADAKITEVMKFFGMTSGEFGKEWRLLSDEEKAYFKAAVGELNA